MEYREIVSVTGLGGLFQLLATKSDGAIVRNLLDKATKFIPARVHNVTPLESIEVYTHEENVRLHEVFEKMKAAKDALPTGKKAGNEDVKAYFKSVFPQLDEDRVYVSDMKKMVKWFELLKENDLLDFSALKAAEEAAGDEVEEEQTEEKPAKKATAKKATEDTADTTEEEKPAKKAPAKKKAAAKKETADDEAPKPAKKGAAKKKKED